jgi:hypothetical protein
MRRGYAAHWSRAHLGHLIPMRYSMLVCLSKSMLSVSESVSRHIHLYTTCPLGGQFPPDPFISGILPLDDFLSVCWV